MIMGHGVKHCKILHFIEFDLGARNNCVILHFAYHGCNIKSGFFLNA